MAEPTDFCSEAPARPGDSYEKQLFDKAKAQAQGGTLGRLFTTEELVDRIFSFQAPTPHTASRIAAVNLSAKLFAHVLLQNCPHCADLTAALRKIREAAMTANAAISHDGLSF